MSQQEDKKVAFNMVIDRSRAKILVALVNIAYHNPIIFAKLQLSLQENNIDFDRDFFDELNEKCHECGFCEDPDCTYEEEHKQE